MIGVIENEMFVTLPTIQNYLYDPDNYFRVVVLNQQLPPKIRIEWLEDQLDCFMVCTKGSNFFKHIVIDFCSFCLSNLDCIDGIDRINEFCRDIAMSFGTRPFCVLKIMSNSD